MTEPNGHFLGRKSTVLAEQPERRPSSETIRWISLQGAACNEKDKGQMCRLMQLTVGQ